MKRGHVALRESHLANPDALCTGDCDPGLPVSVSLHLRNPDEDEPSPGSAADLAAIERPVTRTALAARRRRQYAKAGVAIAAFAGAAGLSVDEISLPRRRIRLSGSARQIAKAFDADIRMYETDGARFLGRTGPLAVTQAIAPWLRAVTGLDQRVKVHWHNGGAAGVDGLWPNAMADLYGIRSDRGADGQCIGLIELGGGYLDSDLAGATAAMGVPIPKITQVALGQGRNAFAGGTLADLEVALDLQVVAGAAPGAAIALYFASWTDFADAIVDAVHDNRRKPSVLAISWGVAESVWTAEQVSVINAALKDANELGIAVTAAAGDKLATDGQFDGNAHVDFPASSPYVVSCGGTRITLSGDRTSIVSETVWNDGTTGTGGGISDLFPVPDYQRGVALPASANGDGRIGRGVPDVAAAAAPQNGYRTRVNGKDIVQPGTSAVAPLIAALIAHANAQRGQSVRMLHPFIYANRELFRRVIEGDNKRLNVGYDAGGDWNACTGLGAPIGLALLSALSATG